MPASGATAPPPSSPNANGQLLTPSAVSLADNGDILVGQAARDRLSTHPNRSVASFKRAMGTTKTFELGTQSFRPEDLSAMVLRVPESRRRRVFGRKKSATPSSLSPPISTICSARPPNPPAPSPASMSCACSPSPPPPALAYGVLDAEREQAILVVDIGGGTFDVSLLQSFAGVMEVRATAGDIFLGWR